MMNTRKMAGWLFILVALSTTIVWGVWASQIDTQLAMASFLAGGFSFAVYFLGISRLVAIDWQKPPAPPLPNRPAKYNVGDVVAVRQEGQHLTRYADESYVVMSAWYVIECKQGKRLQAEVLSYEWQYWLAGNQSGADQRNSRRIPDHHQGKGQ